MAKYAAKGEPRSQTVSTIFDTCVASASNNSNVHSTLRRAMIRAVGERDFSSQETAHLLLSEPLMSCSYMFVTLSLTGSRSLARDESGELTIQQSLFDRYAVRTTQMDMGLVQFASEFSLCKGEIRRRSSPAIVGTFPYYSPNPRGDKYDQYCKYQLLKYKPWHSAITNAWGGVEGSPDLWVREYHTFLQTDIASNSIPHFNEELDSAQRCLQEEDEDSDEEIPQNPKKTGCSCASFILALKYQKDQTV